jgi:hypothetical protein
VLIAYTLQYGLQCWCIGTQEGFLDDTTFEK